MIELCLSKLAGISGEHALLNWKAFALFMRDEHVWCAVWWLGAVVLGHANILLVFINCVILFTVCSLKYFSRIFAQKYKDGGRFIQIFQKSLKSLNFWKVILIAEIGGISLTAFLLFLNVLHNISMEYGNQWFYLFAVFFLFLQGHCF